MLVTVYWDLSKFALVMSTATATTVVVIATVGDTCAAPMPVPMMARTSVIHTRFVERAPVTVAGFGVGGSGGSWAGLGAFRSGGGGGGLWGWRAFGLEGLQELGGLQELCFWVGGLWGFRSGGGIGGGGAGFRSWGGLWDFGSCALGLVGFGGREKTFECLVPSEEEEGS